MFSQEIELQMDMEFELYFPQDNQNTAEAEAGVQLISAALQRCLMLPTEQFWTQVAQSTSFAPCIQSYLQHTRRPHEFLEDQDTPSLPRQILAKNVFLVLHRLLDSRGSQSVVEQKGILRKHGLFCIANVLDLAALYVPQNSDLVRQLFEQLVRLLPEAMEELREAVPKILTSMAEVRKTCEFAAEQVLASVNVITLQELADGLAFLRDCCSSMGALMQASPPFSLVLADYTDRLLPELASVYNALLPKTIKAWSSHRSNPALREACTKVQSRVYWLGKEIETLFSRLLAQKCLQADSASVNGIVNSMQLSHLGPNLDAKQKGQALLSALKAVGALSKKNLAFMANKSLGLDKQILTALHQGIILLDRQQQAIVSELLGSKIGSQAMNGAAHDSASSSQPTGLASAPAIKQIKEVLPDYGDGFLSACLDALNGSSEAVIQHLLEGSLPEFLQHLDPMMPLSEPKTVAPRLATATAAQSSGKQRADNSQAGPSGVRWRELEDVERAAAGLKIHEGPTLSNAKPTIAPHKGTAKALQPSAQERAIAKLHAHAALWEEYDDEYDDSFDDLAGYDADPNADPLGDETETDRGGMFSSQNPPRAQGSKVQTMPKGGKPLWVLNGRIYNHRKEGATPVPNQEAAEQLIRTSQDEIHGLGQGGNKALQDPSPSASTEDDSSANRGVHRARGRGRGRGGREGPSDVHRARVFKDANKAAIGNHHRKDRALRKMGGPAQ